jgi:hypothetical protein
MAFSGGSRRAHSRLEYAHMKAGALGLWPQIA